MAGRGGPKLKEYRQHVTSVRHWLKEIEYEGLIICEVYCGAFGNCQVILPTINQVMLTIDDSEDKMKWLVINVAKLEEEQRHLLAEEEKKKAELESVQRRKALNDKDDTTEGGPTDGSASALNVPHLHDEEETAAKIKTAWDKITIPKLEKYSGYDHPRPLWLLMKDGQVLYELNSANPPKMTKMVSSILTNVPLTEKELDEMDFHPDPNQKKKRKKKPTRKTAQEQAKEEKKKRRAAKKAAKLEIVRPEEFILQVRIADIKKSIADPTSPTAASAAAAAAAAAAGGPNAGGKHPLLVLYTKDPSADDFQYYGQLERIRGDLNPVYHRAFHFNKQDLAPILDSGADVELKFVLYDSESDQVSKEHPPTILGDAYLHLRALIGDGEEGSVVDVKLKKHVAHPPPEKKSARKGKKGAADAAAEENKEEEDDSVGLLTVLTKSRQAEGAVTPYRLTLASKQLPSLNRDTVGVAAQQHSGRNPDGTEMDPALLAQEARRDYFIELQASDANALRPASVGITERSRDQADPVFETRLEVDHRSKDDRVLTFLLYDGLQVDERFFDGLTAGMAYRKELVATAQIKFSAFLTQRKQFANTVTLPWLEVSPTGGVGVGGGAPLNVSSTLVLSADELNDDGTIEPFDPEDDSDGTPGVSQKDQPIAKLEFALQLHGYEKANGAAGDQPDAEPSVSGLTKAPLIAAFVQLTSGAFEFLGQTERSTAAASDDPLVQTQPAQFRKTFLVTAPKAATPAAAATAATTANKKDGGDDDEDGGAYGSSSARRTGSAGGVVGGAGSGSSAAASPRPGVSRTNIYKFVLYDAESDDYTKGASEVRGEATIELSKELLNMGAQHQLTLLDKTSTPLARTSLTLHIQEVGVVSTVDVLITAGGLLRAGPAAGVDGALPNPLVKVYTSHKTLGSTLVLAGETERLAASTDPSFLGKIQLDQYSQYPSSVTVIVYDSPSGALAHQSDLLADENIIGEVTFRLSEFIARSQASAAAASSAGGSGSPQPVEFKLTKMHRSADPAVPSTHSEVNGGNAVVRLVDVTPQAPKRAGGGTSSKKKRRARKVDENGDEVSADDDDQAGEEDGEEEDEDLDESEVAHRSALKQAAAEAAASAHAEVELTEAERTLGCSPAMTDGTKIAVSVGATDIPKKDWLNDKYPLVVLYKKVPSTGAYEYQDCTERVRDENDPKWQKIFLLDNPQGSQYYKLILLDAPRQLSVGEMSVWAHAQSHSRPGQPSERFSVLTRAGGDADHLGEAIIDVQKLLIRVGAEPQRFQDRFGAEVPKAVLQVQATEIGNINALQLTVSATGLPKSELFHKTDPLVVLSARNPNTGALNELQRTERLHGDANPKWQTPLAVDGYSKADRELRLAVYDADASDPNQTFTERDLLGEASTTLNGLLAGAVDLKLTKAGKPVLVGEHAAVLSVRAGARGTSSSRRPESAARRFSLVSGAIAPATGHLLSAGASARSSLGGAPNAPVPALTGGPARSRGPSRPTTPGGSQVHVEQHHQQLVQMEADPLAAAADEQAAIAHALALQAAATPASVVEESKETAQEYTRAEQEAHHEHESATSGDLSMSGGPAAAPEATMSVPPPQEGTSATETEPAQ